MPFDSAHPKRTSITSRITGYNVLIITVCLLAFAWLMHAQLRWSVQQQADALGQSLLQQTHSAASGALSANDTLSVAVLLRELVSNPYVSYAALQGPESRILAEAGQRPKSTKTVSGYYSQQLFSQDKNAGALHLQIDMHKLQDPLTTSMQSFAAIGLALLLLVIFLSLQLGRSIAVPLQSLSNWLINPVSPAPHIQRSDEVGLLARQVNSYFADETEPNQSEAELAEETIETQTSVTAATKQAAPSLSTVSANHALPDMQSIKTAQPAPLEAHASIITPATTARSAILAVEFGNMTQLRKLPSAQLTDLLKKYHGAVEYCAALYDGRLYPLAGGRNLIIFAANTQDHLCNALYCGELLRTFGQHLQADVTDSAINLQIQLGLSDGEIAKDASLGELLLSESAQTALSLSQQSRDQLLLSRSLAQNSSIAACAQTQPVSTPEDASCLEALPADANIRLEEQLDDLNLQIENYVHL